MSHLIPFQGNSETEEHHALLHQLRMHAYQMNWEAGTATDSRITGATGDVDAIISGSELACPIR